MSLFLEKQFVNLVSIKLPLFKRKSDALWNFRCVFCGDSQKNKIKARGYFYVKNNHVFYTCHNCNTTLSLVNFLKKFDVALYNQYQFERFKCDNPKEEITEPKKIEYLKIPNKKINLPTIKELNNEHFAKKYILNRKIPKEYHEKLYYAHDFSLFVKEQFPNTNKNLKQDKRIVIPFFNKEGDLLGVQGRALDNDSKTKYITIKNFENDIKLFGLDTIDLNKKIYVVEGPFDSMFLQNSIATMDSALYDICSHLTNNYQYVFIYDNEKRNSAICKNMLKTINLNLPIFIWPNNIKNKDINEVILSGYTNSEIQSIIDSNTFLGLEALLRFNNWKK